MGWDGMGGVVVVMVDKDGRPLKVVVFYGFIFLR
jgi:hypothetical protein